MFTHPGRLRLQWHLSTALICSLIAAFFLWMNFLSPDRSGAPTFQSFGFPLMCYVEFAGDDHQWMVRNLILNILVACGVLFPVAVVCEWRVARRKKQ